MTPAQLRALRAAYAHACLSTGDGAPSPDIRQWGLAPDGESTWCDPQWVRDLCEEAGVLTPMALPGIWTPWAQVLCHACHGISGPIFDISPGSPGMTLREGTPETSTSSGEHLCKCNDCGAPIWVRSEVGKIAAVCDLINEGTEAKANLQQTGGMCSAVEVRKEGVEHLVVLSALDGDYDITLYRTEEAWADGDYASFSHFDWDEKPSTVEAGILDLLNNPTPAKEN